MGELTFQPHNAHRVSVDGRDMLFHIPTTALFEMDALDGAMFDLFAREGRARADELAARFDRFGPGAPAAVADKLRGLIDLDIIVDADGRAPAPDRPAVKIEQFPLSTIVLNVNTGCNLACSYCYKEDLDAPAKGRKMGRDTAVRAIDLLLKESPDRDSYNIVFFGGEPLSNMALIRDVVAHAEPRFAALGKEVNFSLTTNATLLTAEIIDWLDAHRFGLTVSMDGPKALHDRNRRTLGGRGSYDAVAAKARMLIARYRSRPVGARATLTAGVVDVEAIWDHLKNDLGFAEVGVSPATSGDMAAFNLNGDELAEAFAGMKALGRRYHREALAGRNIGFSNMHQLMQDLYEGRSKALPCGAGVGMLAVDHEGGVNLCHRFTGSDHETYGHVETGLARDRLSAFLEARLDRSDEGCATCRIRNLCSGGCYHESYARYADPAKPVYHYCDLMRDWVDFGIGVYGDLITRAPQFFHQTIAPRRANFK